MKLFIAFITGLTAGGLGCLAVQGGLLISSLAHQLETDLQTSSASGSTGGNGKFQPRIALPITLFLLSKLLAYTGLGFLLGSFGSFLQFTPQARAVLMIVIGIFMLANGLRMLDVHPIFRWFVFSPPTCVTRFIRHTSKKGMLLTTPLALGALTVLLPCGVAQAMMASALGGGDPLQGAAVMFAFTIGTMPVFFAASYFATRLGAVLESFFTRFVALILMVLGVVSIVFGCNLAGAPIALPRWVNNLTVTADYPVRTPLTRLKATESYSGESVKITEEGYSPKVLHLPADRQVRLHWIIASSACCARSVVIPDLDFQQLLSPGGENVLIIPPRKKGTIINYTCSTGRYTGRLVFDQP
jgi:sulfite exporter TauE/SafE